MVGDEPALEKQTLPIQRFPFTTSIAAAILAIAALSGCDRRTAEQLVEEGQRLAAAGQLDDAEKTLRKAEKKDAHAEHLHLTLGAIYVLREDSPHAIEEFKKAVEDAPQDADSWDYLGIALADANQPKPALEAFKKAVLNDPKDDTAYFWLVSLYDDAGDYDNAIEAGRKLVKLVPEDADAWNELAWEFCQSQAFDKCLETVKESIRLNAKDADSQDTLGVALQGLGRFEEAINAYNVALTIAPDELDTLEHLGSALAAAGRTEGVRDTADRIEKLDKERGAAFRKQYLGVPGHTA
jgi:tetratricopeptide (TPR) repeat protein